MKANKVWELNGYYFGERKPSINQLFTSKEQCIEYMKRLHPDKTCSHNEHFFEFSVPKTGDIFHKYTIRERHVFSKESGE